MLLCVKQQSNAICSFISTNLRKVLLPASAFAACICFAFQGSEICASVSLSVQENFQQCSLLANFRTLENLENCI